MSNTRRVFFSTVVQVFARIATSVIGILTLGTVTRYLSVDLFGQLATATIFIALLSTFTDVGLGTATVREIASGRKPVDEILGATMLLRMATAIAIAGIGISLGLAIYRGHHHATTRHALVLLSATLVLATLQSSVTAGMAAALRHDLIVIGDVLGRAVTFALVFLAAHHDSGITAIVMAYVVGAAANAASDLYFGLRRFRPKLRFDRRYMMSVLRVALPLGTSGILTSVYLRADGFMLSVLRTNGEVGRYGVAYRVAEFTLAIPAFFAAAAMPILVRERGNSERLHAIANRSLVSMGALGAPIAAGVVALSPELALLLGGPAYASASVAMAILGVGTIFAFYSSVLGTVIVAAGSESRMVRIFATTLVANVAMNLIAIPLFGITGAACTVVTSEFIALFLLARLCSQIGIRFSGWHHQLRPIACAVTMAGVVAASKPTLHNHLSSGAATIAAAIALGAFVYILAGLATKSLPLAELRALVRPSGTELTEGSLAV